VSEAYGSTRSAQIEASRIWVVGGKSRPRTTNCNASGRVKLVGRIVRGAAGKQCQSTESVNVPGNDDKAVLLTSILPGWSV